jgi:hypothetical protein
LTKGTKYNYRIYAYNGQGQSSYVSSSATIESVPPSIPQNLVATAISSDSVDLTWSVATDDTRVIGYRITRNGQVVGTSDIPKYTDTGLSPNTAYTYTISAYDQAENYSAESASASATTIMAGTGGSAFEGFETNNWTGGTGWSSGWTLFGPFTELISGGAYGGGYHARLRATSSITRTLATGRSGGTLTFGWKAKSIEEGEFAQFLVFDGTWHVVYTVNHDQDDNVYRPGSVDLSGYGVITRVKVSLTSNGSGDSFYFDSIDIH